MLFHCKNYSVKIGKLADRPEDITPEEVFGLATLFEYAKHFKSNIMLDWIKKFLLLRISRLRMGRKELILLGAGIRQLSEGRGKKSIEDLFAGLR